VVLNDAALGDADLSDIALSDVALHVAALNDVPLSGDALDGKRAAGVVRSCIELAPARYSVDSEITEDDETLPL
jgi:hypothetical protein